VSKNVAVFVDVANIFYAAKAAGVDIDYVTLLKASSAGRDLVRAYAYTGLDPDNENQRNFHDFLRRHGYKVVSKDIRKYGDGKVKANLDIELVVDMMKTARNLDIAIVVSGDGDFASAIRAVQEMGVRVEVVSFRGNTSSDLIDVADQFTDITQIAKVEKGSSRSGRRVADDDEDLSMTEVPDKQSEGTGESRRRGRGRSRTTETVAASGRSGTGRGRSRSSEAVVAATGGEGTLVALPGEKLSRAASGVPAVSADRAEDDAEPVAAIGSDAEMDDEIAEAGGFAADAGEGDGRRRRRRRGGRGRGRGRREEGALEGGPEAVGATDSDEDEFDDVPAPARRPAASTFGSVWDSQIGVPAVAGKAVGSDTFVEDDEDLDEPPIPEYLIAERRQRDQGPARGRGGRGGRGSAYAAAMERERFGGGRGSQVSRFGDTGPRRNGGGGSPNRIDRPLRDRGDRGDRGGFRPESRPAPRPVNSDEPWTEVPPEIEAMLRAQLGSGGGRGPASGRAPDARQRVAEAPATSPDAAAGEPVAAAEPGTAAEPATARRTTRRSASASSATAAGEAAAPAPKRRASRSKTADAGAADAATEGATDESAAPKAARASTSRTRTTRAKTPDVAAGEPTAEAAEPVAAPKRRTRRTADTPT
jgi:uncharacterized LabA/DUF88 family protein